MGINSSFSLSELYFDDMYGKLLSVVVTSAPAAQPVHAPTVKEWLRIDAGDTSNDAVIDLAIDAAAKAVEQHTNRALITQERAATFGAGSKFKLVGLPVQTLDSVEKYDSQGNLTALAVSDYIFFADRGEIVLNAFAYYGIRAEYTCGYGNSYTSVPESAQMAILRYVSTNYERREDGTIGLRDADTQTTWKSVAQAIKIYAI